MDGLKSKLFRLDGLLLFRMRMDYAARTVSSANITVTQEISFLK